MKTASRKIRAVAAALCTVFALCTFAVAANAVDIARKCTLTVKLGDNALTGEEAEAVEITAKLYKAADFNGSGYDYTARPGFAQELANYKSFTDSELAAAAAQAAEVVAADEARRPEAEVTFNAAATGTLADLDCGLYLLAATAQDATGTYDYTFTPVLLSLPSMSAADGSDIYDVTGLELKFTREPAKTGIIIQKNLSRYSTLQGPATFIFRVEAVKDDKTVYSNVISMVFTAAGSQQVRIDNIPVGATVTVTEVYGGGSYSITGEGVQIIEKLAAGETPTVTFTNDYNGGGRSSHSVTNRFTPAATNSGTTWTLTPFTDATPDVQ